MRRCCLFIYVLAILCCCSKQESSPTRDLVKRYQDARTLEDKCEILLDTLCSKEYMGRKTGSEYDEKTFAYICGIIREIGFDYQVQEFDSIGGQSKLRNILVVIPGEIDSLIVIGSHFDGAVLSNDTNHYPAANDNASGVVTNLALIDSLKNGRVKNVSTIVCAFWDGEEVFDGSWAQGSRYFIKNFPDKRRIQYYLNLDSVGHDHALYIKHQGYGRIEQALSLLLTNRRLIYVPINMNATSGGNSDYVSFGNEGVPYLAFGDHNGDMCSYNSHSPNDKVEALSIGRIIIHVKNILDLIRL